MIKSIKTAVLILACSVSSLSFAECTPRTFSSDENRVISAYIAYYGRVPDTAGLSWWATELQQSAGDMSQIIEAFGNSVEFDRNFGDLDPETLVNNLYQQSFGRDADAGGLAFYAEELASGRMTLQTIALGIFSGAQNADAEIINNRILSAQQYITLAGHSGIEFEESELQGLTRQIDNTIASAHAICTTINNQFTALDAQYRDTGKLACDYSQNPVNWSALLNSDAASLSEYNLFQNQADPSRNPNCGGISYDLITPLFTDYASKYRFIFIPEGQKILYSENETFEFPVGTVITKTFSVPADTAFRGENENVIETRLLIRRESGWRALPYVWNDDKTDATLARAGGIYPVTLIHNGMQKDFNYVVPDQNKCKQCHQYKAADSEVSLITPIGPKARHLNHDIDYDGMLINQLNHWADSGVLSQLPINPGDIDAVSPFNDTDATTLFTRTDGEITAMAKGYLDINCAHCHRPEGNASNTGLHLEYGRTYSDNKSKHGVCKKPIAYGGGALEYDVIPGNAAESILHFRMASAEAGDRMPEIGRSTVHSEGVDLIAEWINRLPAETCSE